MLRCDFNERYEQQKRKFAEISDKYHTLRSHPQDDLSDTEYSRLILDLAQAQQDYNRENRHYKHLTDIYKARQKLPMLTSIAALLFATAMMIENFTHIGKTTGDWIGGNESRDVIYPITAIIPVVLGSFIQGLSMLIKSCRKNSDEQCGFPYRGFLFGLVTMCGGIAGEFASPVVAIAVTGAVGVLGLLGLFRSCCRRTAPSQEYVQLSPMSSPSGSVVP